jgi:hypothetical protein
MIVYKKDQVEDTPVERGFIHSNGALIFKKDGEYFVVGGRNGTYQTTKEFYDIWRKDATSVIYKGDIVEIQF